jgi:hypothetical protein
LDMRAGAVSAVEGEVLVVALAHGRAEAFDRGSLVAELGGLVRGDLSTVELTLRGSVDDEQLGRLACA